MVTRFHSPRTLLRPRSRNWRKPRADLMMANTGSGVCLRRAYSARPSCVFSRWRHPREGRWIVRRWRRRSEALGQRPVGRLASHRDQRINLCGHTGLHIGLAEVARVGQQRFDRAQLVWQLVEPELRVSYGIEAVIGFGGRGLI